MGEVIAYKPKPDGRESSARVGMILFLAAWSMMFVSLFFTYAFVRVQAPAWPPPGTPEMPRAIAWATTAVAVLAAVTWMGARRAMLKGSRRWVVALLALAFVLGLGFVALHGWDIAVGRKLKMSGSYGSLFMTMIFFHALVAVFGVPAPVVLLRRAARGTYSPQRHIGIRVWALYWYFVAAVWAVMFVVLYLL